MPLTECRFEPALAGADARDGGQPAHHLVRARLSSELLVEASDPIIQGTPLLQMSPRRGCEHVG